MLIVRIITSLIIAPIFIGATYYLSHYYFYLFIGIIILIAAGEWVRLARLTGYQSILFFMSLLTLGGVYLLVPAIYFAKPLLIVAVFWWLFNIWYLQHTHPQQLLSWQINFINGILLLLPMWVAFSVIHQHSLYTLLLVLIIVWSADIGAYFVGKLIGKTKLAPGLSPGKTIEGLLGGMAFSLLSTWVYLAWQSIAFNWFYALLTVILVILSVAGDLYESLYKRRSGQKDSGILLPGHGGILDRIDGLTATLPMAALMAILGYL